MKTDKENMGTMWEQQIDFTIFEYSIFNYGDSKIFS